MSDICGFALVIGERSPSAPPETKQGCQKHLRCYVFKQRVPKFHYTCCKHVLYVCTLTSGFPWHFQRLILRIRGGHNNIQALYVVHHADSERVFEIFSEERRFVTNELIFCCWTKRNKKPWNKENTSDFINSWLLFKSPPKAWLTGQPWYIVCENGALYG